MTSEYMEMEKKRIISKPLQKLSLEEEQIST
jgi:hypothetical protein